jgi:hypothetical protein
MEKWKARETRKFQGPFQGPPFKPPPLVVVVDLFAIPRAPSPWLVVNTQNKPIAAKRCDNMYPVMGFFNLCALIFSMKKKAALTMKNTGYNMAKIPRALPRSEKKDRPVRGQEGLLRVWGKLYCTSIRACYCSYYFSITLSIYIYVS